MNHDSAIDNLDLIVSTCLMDLMMNSAVYPYPPVCNLTCLVFYFNFLCLKEQPICSMVCASTQNEFRTCAINRLYLILLLIYFPTQNNNVSDFCPYYTVTMDFTIIYLY